MVDFGNPDCKSTTVSSGAESASAEYHVGHTLTPLYGKLGLE